MKALLFVIGTLLAAAGISETLDEVPYLDEKGERRIARDVTVIDETTPASLTSVWYAVKGTVTRDSLEVAGPVHLILCDGANLTLKATRDNAPGILVSNSGSRSLSVYGQSDGSGKLDATGGYGGAGIGGSRYYNAGPVMICGGVKFVWNASADLPAGFKAQNIRVQVTVEQQGNFRRRLPSC